MRIIATKAFVGVPDGMVYGREIQPGQELAGDLAQLALREGWAKEQAEPKPPKAPKAEAEPAA